MDTAGNKFQHQKNRQFAVIVLLAIASIAALWWFLTDLHQAYRIVRLRDDLGGSSRRITPAEIQPWMTFDYINRVFHLPPEYLKGHLNITDRHYPRLQIRHYTGANRLDTQQFVTDVRTAVEQYQTQ